MDNNILYSPWRLQYILSEKDKECIFCIKPNEKDDEKHLILFRSNMCFVIMNAFPYNNGHIMVVPNKHASKLSELSNEEIDDLFETVKMSEKVLYQVYGCEGMNIGLNIGKASGAGIDEHLHVHLVPRWIGDSNFMTALSGTRVVPESFERAYSILKEQFDNESTPK